MGESPQNTSKEKGPTVPIMHDSPEWQGIVRDVSQLQRWQAGMEINVANLISAQTRNHEDNSGRLDVMEATNRTLSGEVIRLVTVNSQNTLWLKGIAIVAALFLTLLGIWFARLESTGKVSHIQTTSQSRQDASTPPF